MGGGIFDGVHYYVVDANVKDPTNVRISFSVAEFDKQTCGWDVRINCLTQIKQVLKEGDASREFYMSDLVTHVISDVPVEAEESVPISRQECCLVHVSALRAHSFMLLSSLSLSFFLSLFLSTV